MSATNNATQDPQLSQTIDLGKILRNYLRHWWWFLISLTLCLGLAFIYVKKKSPVFVVHGVFMVNQQEEAGIGKAGSLSSIMSFFSPGKAGGANPENELIKICSQTNLTEVVNHLGLQYNYWTTSGLLRKKDWLYPNQPVQVSIPQSVIDTISVVTEFHLTREKGEKDYTLTIKQKSKKVAETTFSRFPYQAKTPYGTFTLTLTKHFNPQAPLNLYATALSTPSAVDGLRERLAAQITNKKAEGISIDIDEVNIERGIMTINAILENYLADRDETTRLHNQQTLDFIDDRLLSLYNELDSQDSKVEAYKRANRISDPAAEATYIFTRKGAMDEQALQAHTRLEAFRMFRDMLSNPATRENQIPFSSTELGGSEALAATLAEYNSLLNKRLELESTLKPGSRQLDVLNQQIDATRANILKSVGREIQNLQVAVASIDREQVQSDSRIAGMPTMEHRLLTFERDRVVKNQIYAYLLQKREETQLNLLQHESVGKIIDRGYPDLRPSSPNKILILLLGFVFGLAIPMVWLQLRAKKD